LNQTPRPDSLRQEGSLTSDVEVMSSTDRQVFTPEEVARLLGLHPNSVYTMLKSGELPGMKAGRKWLISKRRFEAWLDGGDS
jgi:excisionase family DNA binding protein